MCIAVSPKNVAANCGTADDRLHNHRCRAQPTSEIRAALIPHGSGGSTPSRAAQSTPCRTPWSPAASCESKLGHAVRREHPHHHGQRTREQTRRHHRRINDALFAKGRGPRGIDAVIAEGKQECSKSQRVGSQKQPHANFLGVSSKQGSSNTSPVPCPTATVCCRVASAIPEFPLSYPSHSCHRRRQVVVP